MRRKKKMKNVSKREKLYNPRERREFTRRPRWKWVEKGRKEEGREIHRQKETQRGSEAEKRLKKSKK